MESDKSTPLLARRNPPPSVFYFFSKAQFCLLVYNWDRRLSSGRVWFHVKSLLSSPAMIPGCGYLAELDPTLKSSSISIRACFKCPPKRCESVSGQENLEEM